GTVNNNGAIDNPNGTFAGEPNSVITNAGALNVFFTFTLYNDTTFTNTGDISISCGGDVVNNNSLTNNGTIILQGGTIENYGTLTNNKVLTIWDGSTLTNEPDATFINNDIVNDTWASAIDNAAGAVFADYGAVAIDAFS